MQNEDAKPEREDGRLWSETMEIVARERAMGATWKEAAEAAGVAQSTAEDYPHTYRGFRDLVDWYQRQLFNDAQQQLQTLAHDRIVQLKRVTGELARRLERQIGGNGTSSGYVRLRYQVLTRDDFQCRYCGRSPLEDRDVTLQIDHITPKASGGQDEPDNLVTACSDCNQGKGDVLLEQYQREAVTKREALATDAEG
jgi:hypothetical protein